MGLGTILGAFLFGIGMIFGGGCGSGTLYTVGGGSSQMAITLAAFIAGSVLGTLHLPYWTTLPQIGGFSMIDSWGVPTAVTVLLALLGALYWGTIKRERRYHGTLETGTQTRSFSAGPWSLLAGVAALAIVSIATLLATGRPWGITFAFGLWGAKILAFLGTDVALWPFWKNRTGVLERSIFADFTSLMNFGIIWGAFTAAHLARRFQPKLRLTGAEVFTALLGGILMGYGARLAYGCNIGAYLGGLISGSAHGWLWMVAAFSGSILAIRVRARLHI